MYYWHTSIGFNQSKSTLKHPYKAVQWGKSWLLESPTKKNVLNYHIFGIDKNRFHLIKENHISSDHGSQIIIFFTKHFLSNCNTNFTKS